MNRLAPVLIAVAAYSAAAAVFIPNADFSVAPNGRPDGWEASNASNGTWTAKGGCGDTAAIRVAGDGTKDVRWHSGAIELEPDRCYAFSFWMQGRGSGSVVCGTDHVNVDLDAAAAEGTRRQFVFRTPPRKGGVYSAGLHLGQWMMSGEVLFDDVALTPVKPVYRTSGDLVLGAGEQVDGNTYVFATQFSSAARNHARPLTSAGARFNTSRWCLGGGDEVVYRHALPSRTWKKVRVSATCGYYAAGSCELEVSADGANWTSLARISQSDSIEVDVPEALLPARELLVRFRGNRPCSLQIHNYAFEAEFAGPAASAVGSTAFVEEGTDREVCALPAPKFFDTGYGERFVENNELNVWRASSGWKIPRGRALPTTAVNELLLKTAANEAEAVQLVVRPQAALSDVSVSLAPGGLKNAEGVAMPAGTQVDILRVGYVRVRQPTDGTGCRALWPDPLLPQEGACPVPAGQNQPFWIRVKPPKGTPAGTYRGVLAVHGVASDGHAIADVQVPFIVEVFGFDLPDMMACETSFGFNPGTVGRYHCLTNDAHWRLVVDKYLKSLGDHHISPYDPVPGTKWSVRWKGLDEWKGGVFDTEVKASGKASMKVVDASTTANASLRYRDLMPLGKGVRVRFRYRTDQGQKFGCCLSHHRADGSWMRGRNRDYRPDSSATEWRTFDETWTGFPKEATDFSLVFYAAGYQEPGVKTGTLWVDDVSVTDVATGRELVEGGDFESMGDPMKAVPAFDWTEWDQAMEDAFAKYRFNTFVMRVDGLGGGTYEGRREPSYLGYPASHPAYDVLMGRYLGGIERHLREKGWLDKALVYWFDEPEPKDYPFVMQGFQTLKKHAPGLRRMLTEEAVEALHGGPNLWVPLTPNLHVPGEKKARAAGDQFWWYVCCGPKAPYVTEFTDHPGTEMRLWLWQTWGENVTGILIWETTWWTSSNAYPDPKNPQNPYEDAMCWCASATLGKGAKSPWGNGDGRFLYPPLKAARPAKTPVLDDPVASYRLEMLRDGIEDYEYFAMLKRLLAARTDLDPAVRARYEALLKVPADVYTSLTAFATDPASMEAHRLKLARAIEALSGRPVQQDERPALQARIDAAAQAGGGRVTVPAGEHYLEGPIHLRSNIELHLEEGAKIVFADDPQFYLPSVLSTWEGVECKTLSPLVYAYGCTNVAITGKGTFAPKMDFWRTWFKREKGHMDATRKLYDWCSFLEPVENRDVTKLPESNVRPHLMQFNRCRNVRLEGFRIRESPFWTVHLFLSRDCVVRGLDVYAHGHNNDGVDIEMSQNVLVENCTFDQGDDAIVIKSGRNRDAWRLATPSENIEVRNCKVVNGHVLLGVGSEMSGGVRNVYMHDCELASEAFRLFYVKVNERRGGFVENIRMENVKAKKVKFGVMDVETDVIYQWKNFPTHEVRVTPIRNLSMKNVTVESAKWLVHVKGDKRLPVRDILLENVACAAVARPNVVEHAENVQVKTNPWVLPPASAEVRVEAEAAKARLAAKTTKACLVGHRGDSETFPENTMPAFRSAADKGFNIETDLYLTQDGVVFLTHDQRINRKGSGLPAGIWATNTVWKGQLDRADAGAWMGEKWKGTKYPTLDDLLPLARDGRFIILEVKDPRKDRILPAIAQAIARHPNVNPGNVYLQGAHGDLARILPGYKDISCTLARKGPAISDPPLDLMERARKLDPKRFAAWNLRWDEELVTKELVDLLHSRGIRVCVWTVNDAPSAWAALGRGVDWICTDRPAALAREMGLAK